MPVSDEVLVVVCDRDGDAYGEIPEAEITSLTWVLNDSGTGTFGIDPLSDGAEHIRLVEREIQVWMEPFDDPVWWGVPWGFTGNHAKLTLNCEGLLSLFTKRFIDRMSLDYDSVDQLSIAWDVLDYAQSETLQANRDLNISAAGFLSSGNPRSPRYNRDEHKNILDILKEFDSRKLKNGFDWEIVVHGDGGRFWTPYYPRKGSLKTNYAMEWEVDGYRNITGFTFTADGLPLATHVYATGGTSGEVKMENNYEDVAASEKYGVMQAVVSEGSQLDVGWLLDRAQREVETRKEPIQKVDITSVRTDDMDLFKNLVEGDSVSVRIDHGMIQADAVYRVESVTWTPGSLVFAFVQPEVAA